MNNHQKSLIMGGILVAGGLIGWYAFYRKRKETPLNYAPVPRDQVLTILANIAYQNECLVKELSNLQDLTSPSMIEKLNEFRKIACTKGEVEEKVLRVVSERDFSEDRQIQSLRNEAFTAYDKGIAIISAIKEKKGAEFLTPELILGLLCKEYKERSYKMHESLMELKKQGIEIDMREPTADRVAVAAVFNDPKFLEIRKSTISELGLDPSNKEYDNVLEEISRLYMIQDKDDFMQKVMIMSAQSNTVLESLSFDSPDAIALIEEIGTYQ